MISVDKPPLISMPTFVFLILATVLFVSFYIYIKFPISTSKRSLKSNRFNINDWMNMSKEKRNRLGKDYSNESMIRKKKLLEKIRKEYSRMKK